MIAANEFTRCNVHGLVYKDELCDYAAELREELLKFPYWSEMLQQGETGNAVIKPQNQNGITTGHLTEHHRPRLPHCLKFRDWMQDNLRELCEVVGVEFADNLLVEINAMAYGDGGWLAPHTDSGGIQSSNDRIIAWMFYLTHPDDDEWPTERGGAVRLWIPKGEEVRVKPKFNRFAMFRVSNKSFHEIEKISWNTGWERCRLALSGWIRGTYSPPERKMRVYQLSKDFLAVRSQKEANLRGSLALYELMLQQRQHTGRDSQDTLELLRELREDYAALEASPPGTIFLRRLPGPAGCITVLNESQQVCFLGAPENFTGDPVLSYPGAPDPLRTGIEV